MEPGYGSPIGARDTVVVVDDLVARSPNLVAGANREGFHYRNVNVGRDFTADVIADITNAQEGDACPTCGEPVDPAQRHRGRQHLQARDQVHRCGRRHLPRRGRRRPTRSSWARTGSASGGTSPASSRPTTTTRASSGRPRSRPMPPTSSRSATPRSRASPRSPSASTSSRSTPGREILWDDRDESPGVKFTDAELLGMPWILTVSPAVAGGRRRRGHRACDRRAVDPPDRGRRGAPQSWLRSSGISLARADRTSAICSSGSASCRRGR